MERRGGDSIFKFIQAEQIPCKFHLMYVKKLGNDIQINTWLN